MSYTESDLAAVQSAIVSLATGTRKVSVTIGGERVECGQAALSDLRQLRSEMSAELSAASTAPSGFVVSTGKGL